MKPRKPRMTVFERDLRAAFERTVLPENVDLALQVVRADSSQRNWLIDLAREQGLERVPYGYNNHGELKLHVLDKLLGTHGVESLGDVHMFNGPPFEYLNTGDSYCHTVVRYRSSGRFYIRDYAHIVTAYRLK